MQVAGVAPVAATVPVVLGALYVGQRMRRAVRERAGNGPARSGRGEGGGDPARP